MNMREFIEFINDDNVHNAAFVIAMGILGACATLLFATFLMFMCSGIVFKMAQIMTAEIQNGNFMTLVYFGGICFSMVIVVKLIIRFIKRNPDLLKSLRGESK